MGWLAGWSGLWVVGAAVQYLGNSEAVREDRLFAASAHSCCLRRKLHQISCWPGFTYVEGWLQHGLSRRAGAHTQGAHADQRASPKAGQNSSGIGLYSRAKGEVISGSSKASTRHRKTRGQGLPHHQQPHTRQPTLHPPFGCSPVNKTLFFCSTV